jgi:hypothetical protein
MNHGYFDFVTGNEATLIILTIMLIIRWNCVIIILFG